MLIWAEFDKLNRLVAKDTSKQSHKLYIKTLVSLEDLQNESIEREKAAKKKMNTTNARALNTFRQRIRKNNREYEADIKKFREDPSAFDTESEDEAAPRAREVRDEIIGPDGQVQRGFLAAEEDDEDLDSEEEDEIPHLDANKNGYPILPPIGHMNLDKHKVVIRLFL